MEEQRSPEQALTQVNQQVIAMAVTEEECERGYAQLGWMLLEVATMQYWRVAHQTFRDYLRTIAMSSKRTASQLQQYFLTVRDLSDTFTLTQLEAMGISKAIKLRQAKDYAIVLPSDVVQAALDSKVTVKELQKVISTTLKMPEESGDYLDLGFEFMVSPEERATLEAAVDAAMHTDPITKTTISKSAQMKDIALKFAMEFLGAHSGDGQ
jgi:hypothetical protein